MSDQSMNDPNLQALESRLANMVLRVSPQDAQNMLYQCAFEAGKAKARKTIRRWQSAVAMLIVVSLGLSVSLLNQKISRTEMVQQGPASPVPSNSAVASSNHTHPSPAPDVPPMGRKELDVDLGAWQLRSTHADNGTSDLAWVVHSDPTLQPYTVGALTRSVLVP